MKLKHTLIGTVLLCISIPAFAQKTDLSSVISGKDAPATLKLKDLTGEWRRMKFVGTTMTGSGMEGLMGLMSNLGPLMQAGMMSEMGKGAAKNAGGGAGMDTMMPAVASMLGGMFGGGGEPVYYTKGQTVEMGSDTFLITYRHKQPKMDLMQMMMGLDKPGAGGKAADDKANDPAKMMESGKLNADSDLGITLINTKAIGMINDLRPFDMQKEIDEANAGNGLAELMAAGMKADGGKAIEAAADANAKPVPASESVEEDITSEFTDDASLSKPGNKITVKVADNVVILSGTASTAQMKQRAVNIANRKIKELGGGYTVRNEIKVK